MNFKPGSRWKGAACTTEIVVVRPPRSEVTLECGGHPMLAASAARPDGLSPSPAHSGGVSVGKRYVDPASGLEVLGSKHGQGSLSVDGRALQIKEAKALPASD